jgi:hypothetical protein
MPASILELQDLYNEALVRELVEKTQNGAITWTFLGGTNFTAESIQTSDCTVPFTTAITWDYFITKSQIGNISFTYNLDVKKNGVNVVSLTDGPLPYTARDSVTKDLYEIVELLVLNLDDKLKDAIRYTQSIGGLT